MIRWICLQKTILSLSLVIDKRDLVTVSGVSPLPPCCSSREKIFVPLRAYQNVKSPAAGISQAPSPFGIHLCPGGQWLIYLLLKRRPRITPLRSAVRPRPRLGPHFCLSRDSILRQGRIGWFFVTISTREPMQSRGSTASWSQVWPWKCTVTSKPRLCQDAPVERFPALGWEMRAALHLIEPTDPLKRKLLI